MASFDVLVRRLDDVVPHPNADRLDLAVIGGYRCVVGKSQFSAGDLVAYLPEALRDIESVTRDSGGYVHDVARAAQREHDQEVGNG